MFKTNRWIRCLSLLFLLSGSWSLFAMGRYTDIYNFFSLVPPDGWKAKVYSDPRSKVKFLPPADAHLRHASIFVVVNPAGAFNNLNAEGIQRMEQFKKLGAVGTQSKSITFSGAKCVHIMTTLPKRDISISSYLFSKYGRAYTIILTSSLSDRDKVESMFATVMEGFQCVPPDDFMEPLQKPAFDLDIDCTLLDTNSYPGVVGGKLNYVELKIHNKGSKPIEMGNHFRVLMNKDSDSWNQFALAAISTNGMRVSNAAFLRYGLGCATMSLKKQGDQSLLLFFQGMRNVVNDGTATKKKINLNQWWPEKVAPGRTVAIKWPTFWFSDTDDVPQAIVGPELRCGSTNYYSWLEIGTHKVRLVTANTKSLLEILNSGKEPIGLRCATIGWLLNLNPANTKYLRVYLKDGAFGKSLNFRAMQAVMIWGSAKDLDYAYSLWKSKKLAKCLDYDFPRYLSWSHLARAGQLVAEVKLGGR